MEGFIFGILRYLIFLHAAPVNNTPNLQFCTPATAQLYTAGLTSGHYNTHPIYLDLLYIVAAHCFRVTTLTTAPRPQPAFNTNL